MSVETLTRWQDPTIDDLIKENLELKRKLGEADDAVEYWQIECDKRSKVLDKIKKYILQNCEIIRLVEENVDKVGRVDGSKILELLEEIE